MLGIFLDIETTGLDASRHVPIDIAFRIIDLSNGSETCSYHAVIAQPEVIWNLHDPSSIAINGYSWEMVSAGKPLNEVREEILMLFKKALIERGKAVFICQNPSFDRGFFAQIIDVYTQEKLNWPYHWLDFASMYWSHICRRAKENKIPLPKQINLSKNAIGKEYGIPPESLPHRGMNGVDHLILCYRTVIGFPESSL